MLILGFDPGGKNNNGAAVLKISGKQCKLTTKTFDCLSDVLSWFKAETGRKVPKAIGIDSCLAWSPTAGGNRSADHRLREKYKGVRNSIMPPNSLRGAMLIQGVAAVIELRNKWKKLIANETHPKVAYYSLTGNPYRFGQDQVDWLLRKFDQIGGTEIRNEHEWDAAFSAWATWQGLAKKWKFDLFADDTNLIEPFGGARYFWHESLTA
jgi:hypothetical protein